MAEVVGTPDSLGPGRGRSFDHLALEVVAAGGGTSEAAQQMRDYNFCSLWLGGVPVGPVVGAASPRTAVLRCASLALRGCSTDDSQKRQALQAVRLACDRAESPLEAADSVQKQLLAQGILIARPQLLPPPPGLEEQPGGGGGQAARQVLTVCCSHDTTTIMRKARSDEKSQPLERQSELSVPRVQLVPPTIKYYCPDCQMFLNGPTQMADHNIGKKHIKTVMKKARQKAGVHFADHTTTTTCSTSADPTAN